MTPDEELVNDGTDADFDAGYAGTPTEPKTPETPADGKGAASTAEATAGDGKGEQTVVAETTQAAPEYVQLTKGELEELRAAAAKTASYDHQFARINGTLGNLKQNITKPAADKTDGQQLVKDGATETPTVDQDAVGRQRASEAIVQHELEVLAAEHPNWREIVGAPEKDGVENVDKANPFRVWLAAQPAEYQTKINATNSSFIIMKAIDRFNADAAKSAATRAAGGAGTPRVDARRTAIKDAVQPRGDGGRPPPAKTDEDHFAEGFASG